MGIETKQLILMNELAIKNLNLEESEHIKIRMKRKKGLTLRTCIICKSKHKKPERSAKCKRCSVMGGTIPSQRKQKHVEKEDNGN